MIVCMIAGNLLRLIVNTNNAEVYGHLVSIWATESRNLDFASPPLLSKTKHKLALGFRGKHDRILVIIRLISLLHQPTTINNRCDEVYRKSCPSPLPQLSFKTHSPKLV